MEAQHRNFTIRHTCVFLRASQEHDSEIRIRVCPFIREVITGNSRGIGKKATGRNFHKPVTMVDNCSLILWGDPERRYRTMEYPNEEGRSWGMYLPTDIG